METAKEMKKRKDATAKQKELGMVSAELEVSGPAMATAKAMKPMASSVVSGILKDVVKKEQPKEANAVTEIDGEMVKWKAGKNPAYEEKLMKLKKKK